MGRRTLLPVGAVALAAVLGMLCPARSQPAPGDVPAQTDSNIIVASYNIQWLGEKPHDLAKLAKAIRNFDVCGLIEIKDEDTVRRLAKALRDETGHDWGFVYGIRTHRPKGKYHEAYGAVWRRDRVQLGDGITSNIWDLEEAFRNDPYVVSFRRGNFDFTLLLVHTRWSDDAEGTRETEVAMLAEQLNWMRTFLRERDFIVAGDFNYPGTHAAMQSFRDEAGLEQLDADPETTFKADGTGYASAYDHMYVFAGQTTEFASRCEALDVTKLVYGDRTVASMKKARSELSDHLPVWAEFRIDGPDDDATD